MPGKDTVLVPGEVRPDSDWSEESDLGLGRGIALKKLVPDEPKGEGKKEEPSRPKSRPRSSTQAEWVNSPSVPDQFTNPDLREATTRTGHTQCKTFTLPDDEDQYNLFLEQASNPEGPRYMIQNMSKEFHDGTWKVFVLYSHFLYKKLTHIDLQNHKDEADDERD